MTYGVGVPDVELDDLTEGFEPLDQSQATEEYSVFDDADLGLTDDSDPGKGAKPTAPPADSSVTDYIKEDLAFRRQQQQQQQQQLQLQQQQEAERQRNEAKAAKLKAIDDQIAALIPKVEPLNLPSEVLNTYTPETRQVIGHMAREQAAQLLQSVTGPMRQMMQQNLEYSQQLEELRAATQPNPQAQVNERLRMAVPDIDNVMGDPGWEAYRRSVIPGTDLTVGEIVGQAYTQGNVARVKQYIDKYRASRNTRRQETPGVAPRNSSGPVTSGARKPILRYSELDQAYNRHQQGLIDKAKLNKIEMMFEAAAAENRVNYDK